MVNLMTGCRTRISFLALRAEEVRLLHTRLHRIGRGAGTRLVGAAKSSGVEELELWCFQANTRARVASLKPEAFTRSAFPMERTTTFAIGGNLQQVAD
jgi:hypothetical protein